jgi:hypothetical protein
MKATEEGGTIRSGDPERSASGPECPHCRSVTYRIPRRLADRVLSLFVIVHRYRCRSLWTCGWEGILFATEHSRSARTRDPEYCGRRYLEPSRMSPMMPSEKLPR